MKIDINNKYLLRFFTFIPPALGILMFTYFIKIHDTTSINERLPLYQGLNSYFSLMLIGFTYIKNKNAVFGKKIFLFLFPIFIAPILFFLSSSQDILIVIFFSCIFFLSSLGTYLMLINNQMFYYLMVVSINSLILPLILFFNSFFLILLSVLWLVFILFLIRKLRPNIEKIEFGEVGLSLFKSVLIQSPFLLLPFFDYKIAAIIGDTNYANYVLSYKYINGGITVLFSYKQLNLVFGKKTYNTKQIVVLLISLLLIIGICSFIKNYYSFILILVLYSLGLNYGSLIIRNILLKEVSFIVAVLSFCFVIFYILFLNYFAKYISINNNLFVFLMSICTIIPSLLTTKLISIKRE